MDAAGWSRLSALYDELVDLPGPQRQARLAAVQPPELAERLARMLDHADTPSVPTPAGAGFGAHLAAALAPPPAAATQPGDRLGAWALVRLLGEGGMGAVWLAERADGLYQGQAAIKLLKWSSADLAAQAGAGLAERFARERALLGRLTHPGIARLLDAGQQGGRAYLVLEHVAGQTLSAHVREHQLGLDARVQLLLAVARAVEHAHAQLIVHRDLKPSNVMVDAGGAAKLLDFGIAGLLDDSGAQADHQLTQLAGRRLTPAYAAPEQISGGAIGVAADVYSLGVMLFELASGALPFGRRGATRTQLEHAVLHTEAPRLNRRHDDTEADSGPGRPHDAERARGDLEAIAAKALRKEAAERYPTVGAFTLDLQRWLEQRPVSVRAEDWRHRAGLWIRRNAAVAVGGTLVLATLSAGLGVSLWQRSEAQAAAAQSQEVTRYLTELLASANPDRHAGRVPSVVELLDASRAGLGERFAHDPLTHARVLAVMAATYGDMNRHDIAIPLSQQMVALATRLWGPDHPDTLAAEQQLARSYTALGWPLEVIAIGERLQPLLIRHQGEGASAHTNLLYQLAVAYAQAGREAEAQAALDRAWPQVQAQYRPDDFETIFFNTYVAQLRTLQGRWQEVEQLLLATQPHWATAPRSRARFVVTLKRSLWVAQARLGRPEADAAQAAAVMAEMDALLGPGNANSARFHLDIARQWLERGDVAGALRHFDAINADRRAASVEHPSLRLPAQVTELLARTLAGADRASTLVQAHRLLAEVGDPRAVSGPAWADASLSLARVGLLLGELPLAEQALTPLLGPGAPAWLARHAGWRSRAEQLQGELLLARGQFSKGLALLARRVAYFNALPEPQGIPAWSAELGFALGLHRAGTLTPAALARADALRPAWLGAHPLDALRRELGHGRVGAWAGRL